MNSPEILGRFEHCRRDGYWSLDWQRARLDPREMLQEGILSGLTSSRTDFGQHAGERCFELGANPGLHAPQYDSHSQVVHISSVADIVCTAIRSQGTAPWGVAKTMALGQGPVWNSEAFIDPRGQFLRRVVLVSAWSNERHYSEARSYFSLGEVCVYGMPLQEAVIILGPYRDGKWHSPWTKGLLHPRNKKLRFRKKNDVKVPFAESWIQVWREDRDEIQTKEWLEAMMEDDILTDHCFSTTIPVPEPDARKTILDLIKRKLDDLNSIKELPDQNLSTCEWPMRCSFHGPCHAGEQPNGRYGFVRTDQIRQSMESNPMWTTLLHPRR